APHHQGMAQHGVGFADAPAFPLRRPGYYPASSSARPCYYPPGSSPWPPRAKRANEQSPALACSAPEPTSCERTNKAPADALLMTDPRSPRRGLASERTKSWLLLAVSPASERAKPG